MVYLKITETNTKVSSSYLCFIAQLRGHFSGSEHLSSWFKFFDDVEASITTAINKYILL